MDDKKIALRLNNKRHTGFGISSFFLGVISLCLFLGAIFISALVDRTVRTIIITIGMMELVGILLCLVGIVYGVIGEFTKETFKIYAHIGIGINCILMIFHILVLVYGYAG